MLSKGLAKKYDSIDLFNRYRILSEKFNPPNPLDLSNHNKVSEIFQSLNSNFKFNKKEGIFALSEQSDGFEFKLNLSIKYGVVETVLWGKNLVTGEQYGGPISRLIKQVQIANGAESVVRVNYPRFSSEDELKEIVQELYEIFIDFKRVIAQGDIAG